MGILTGLREVLHNFTNPVEDTNAPTVEISAEAFVAMAKKSGMTHEQIQECLKNMNGITIAKKQARPVQRVQDRNSEDGKNKKSATKKRETEKDKDLGREPGE